MPLPRGLLKSLIREGYSAPDAMREAWRRVRLAEDPERLPVRVQRRRHAERRSLKNPGAKWHGKEATRAEGDRWASEQSGKLLGSFYYKGKRDAHRESQDASRQMGLNPSSAYDVFLRGKKIDTVFQSDPSSAEEVKRSLVEHDGYDPDIRVVKQRRKPRKNPGAAWYEVIVGNIGSVYAGSSGAVAEHTFRTYVEQSQSSSGRAAGESVVLLKDGEIIEEHPGKENPGAAWHEGQERMAEAMEKRETRPRRRTYLKGMADAHQLSAHESRKMGLNPKTVRFKDLPIGAVFEFSARREWWGKDLASGPWKKEDSDHYSHVSDQKLKHVKVGSRNVEVDVSEANPRPSAIPAHKLAAANRYVNLIRNKQKRDYGFALLSWLKGGAVGDTPEAPAGLSVMAAQAVRLELDAMKLWENPRGAKTVVGRVFRAKRWAQRWARGRPVRRVQGGWQVQAGRKRRPNPERKPQGGVYAYVKDRGRVWVESINSIKGTAHVRFDPGEGMRSRVHVVPLSAVDFSREWRINRNPIAVYNPPPGRLIYGRVLSVEAQKTNGSHKGKRFRHSFAGDSRVAAYALPDGSVLLKSQEGKRLWADR